jgi:hypothetical protein
MAMVVNMAAYPAVKHFDVIKDFFPGLFVKVTGLILA